MCRVNDRRGELSLAGLHARVMRRMMLVKRVGNLVGEKEAPDTPEVGVAAVALHSYA